MRWRLVVRMITGPGMRVEAVKEIIGRDGFVAVSNRGPETVISVDYDTEGEAQAAYALAVAGLPNAVCYVEEIPPPNV